MHSKVGLWKSPRKRKKKKEGKYRDAVTSQRQKNELTG